MSSDIRKSTSPKFYFRGYDVDYWREKLDIPEKISDLAPFVAEQIIIKFQTEYYLSIGIIFRDYSNFYIEGLPPIGKGTILYPGVFLDSRSNIGEDVKIYPNCFIENSEIGNSSMILPGSVIRDSVIKTGAQIGPYSHLRNGVIIENRAKVGNFVEMKKSVFGGGSKAMHLSYIGNATVGKNVNIGAGTITCNYDGVNKSRTLIEDDAFIGSGTELIAPITIGGKSYIAAGSTINEDVPADSLAIARQKQRLIQDWNKRKRKKV